MPAPNHWDFLDNLKFAINDEEFFSCEITEYSSFHEVNDHLYGEFFSGKIVNVEYEY
ncbi:hypothetical protein O59_001741 [Cellvibrio sp. BR]|nr:hypothetical protein O59_001741 [Cellvibrio sp. BR]